MTNEQIKNSEKIVNDFLSKRQGVYAKEASLAVAKEIQGLRAVFEEVTPCAQVKFARKNRAIIYTRYTLIPCEFYPWMFPLTFWLPIRPDRPARRRQWNFAAEREWKLKIVEDSIVFL